MTIKSFIQWWRENKDGEFCGNKTLAFACYENTDELVTALEEAKQTMNWYNQFDKEDGDIQIGTKREIEEAMKAKKWLDKYFPSEES